VRQEVDVTKSMPSEQLVSGRAHGAAKIGGHHAVAGLAVVACLVFPAPAAAQDRVDPLAATVAQWFTMIEQSFIGLAEAMPAEKYAFRPTDGAFEGTRTFGEQVKHVACGNFAFFNEIEKKTLPNDVTRVGPAPRRRRARSRRTCGIRLLMREACSAR